LSIATIPRLAWIPLRPARAARRHIHPDAIPAPAPLPRTLRRNQTRPGGPGRVWLREPMAAA
jgi:hypothetical protein